MSHDPTPEDPRQMMQGLIDSVEWHRTRIRQHRPSIATPAEEDVHLWTAADLEAFTAAVDEWHAYYQQVSDRVTIFIRVGIERANAHGTSIVPDGFDEALRADDVSTLDRMMSAVEDYFPDLLSFPEEVE